MVIVALLFPFAVLVLLLYMSLLEDRLNTAVQRIHRSSLQARRVRDRARVNTVDR